jgi:two-component system, NarL family, nitrate/nitrite response regulator NarL
VNRGTRIVLVDDHALIAQTIRLALAAEGFDVTVVSPVPSTPDRTHLLANILAASPRLVLLDLDLGSAGDGARLIQPIRQAGADVVVVTATTDPLRIGQCLAHGAQHVLSKATPLEEIVGSLHRVLAGRPALGASQRQSLVAHWQRQSTDLRSRRARLDRLSRREAEILAALMEGQRVREIAQASYVSEATARTQVKAILFKLGVTSQIGAVAVARDTGWTVKAHVAGHYPGSSAS